MESMSPIHIKRLRTKTDINNMPLIECKREFILYQQYPSTVMPGWNRPSTINKTNNVIKHHVANGRYVPIAPKAIKNGSVKETNLLSNVKKLRIRSKDGRDLGEMNVQFLPKKDNTLHGKTITVTKPSFMNSLNKPVKISILPGENNRKILSISPIHKKDLESTKVPVAYPKPILSSLTSPEAETKNITSVQKPQITVKTKQIKQCRICEINNLQPKKIIDAQVNNEVTKVQPSTGNVVRCTKVLKDSPALVNLENDRTDGILDHSNNRKFRRRLVIRQKDDLNKSLIQNKKESYTNAKWYAQIAHSKFPIVKCERLCIPAQKDISRSTMLNKRKQSNDEEVVNKEHKQIKAEVIIAEENENTAYQDQTTEKPRNIPVANTHNPGALEQNNKIHKPQMILVKDATTLKKTTNPSADENDLQSSRAKDCVPPPIKLEDLSIQMEDLIVPALSNVNEACDINTGQTTNSQPSPISSKTLPTQENLSDSWSIIQKALSSVTDDELRTKALQALADCGIGIERRVPIPPPEQLKSVHDTQTQTEIFSLLEKENFVLVRKDLPNVQRIKQPDNALSNYPGNISIQCRKNQSNLTTSDNVILGSVASFPSFKNIDNSSPPIFTEEDIDNMLNILCKDNAEANKVREVLSPPNPVPEKIMCQLKKDFELRAQRDGEGMLNIHRAVVTGNTQDLERYIMVLKACRESVDLETLNGETSLELAIKYNSPVGIVRALLEAGAQPTSTKSVHDSAVLLASKKSSPMLPELLKYVTNVKLLDQVNADGFAAIHYCVLNNNLRNLSALIQAGANVDLRDKRSGRTPFFHAVQNSYNAVAQKLLDAGAVVNLPNFSGQTVLMFADDVSSVSLKAALSKQMNAS